MWYLSFDYREILPNRIFLVSQNGKSFWPNSIHSLLKLRQPSKTNSVELQVLFRKIKRVKVWYQYYYFFPSREWLCSNTFIYGLLCNKKYLFFCEIFSSRPLIFESRKTCTIFNFPYANKFVFALWTFSWVLIKFCKILKTKFSVFVEFPKIIYNVIMVRFFSLHEVQHKNLKVFLLQLSFFLKLSFMCAKLSL